MEIGTSCKFFVVLVIWAIIACCACLYTSLEVSRPWAWRKWKNGISGIWGERSSGCSILRTTGGVLEWVADTGSG